jgi:FkbH-like protein
MEILFLASVKNGRITIAKNMKYSEIIRLNNELENTIKGQEYKIVILSNIMIHQAKDICEYLLRTESINTTVLLGEYDNIVQDSATIQDANSVLIFWEACNFIDGLQYKLNTLSRMDFQNIIEKIKLEIDLVFGNLKNVPLVLINEFSLLIFDQFSLPRNRVKQLIKELNLYLESTVGENVKIINVNKVISQLSINSSIDLRYYYSSKTLYRVRFYRQYFEHIKPFFLSATGRIKKALIFDCDNTLWKGVLGEDGFDGIKMYQEIQYLALDLSKQGVVIGLCSKNNPKDVDNVLKNHPDITLRSGDITIKKVNWQDKVSNLKLIARDLNIGLDSLVFIDDSDFEIGLIKKYLPEVRVFQVPDKTYEYGLMLRGLSNLFYNPSKTKEDIKKIQIYKEQFQRDLAKEKIGNIESYLESLELILTVHIDEVSQISRISQITQKTNQFNLTTKRHTESEIGSLVDSDSSIVIAINVSDKYGDSGLTGLAILNIIESEIDTLLLSCRILGRNIEYKFMDIIVNIAKKNGLSELNSRYIKTHKNQQVVDFYERCGFKKIDEFNGNSEYRLQIGNYKNQDLKYIEVKCGR